jgi:prenyltransferase beta subunit
MKLWEKLSATFYRLQILTFQKIFEDKSLEKVLKRSMEIMEPAALAKIKTYIIHSCTPSGGFADKSGRPDLYYTFFGYHIAESLGINSLFPAIHRFNELTIRHDNLDEIHLHCAAILASRLHPDKKTLKQLRERILKIAEMQPSTHQEYFSYLRLLSAYYLSDFSVISKIQKQVETHKKSDSLPAPSIAALLVATLCSGKPVDDLISKLLSFYREEGGFNAVHESPEPDLLSTAVSLYALNLAGYDMRIIRPSCLEFVESLYIEGGFGGNRLDPDPDIEFTFYGLLALGSLAD